MVQCWTDGGSKGNPGASYGSFRIEIDGKLFKESLKRDFGKGTNNEAEYKALINCVYTLNKYGLVDAVIFTDSQLVIGHITLEWKCEAKNLRGLVKMVKDMVKDGHVLKKVPREVIEKKLGH
jgi:ribonuclease HI